MMADADLDEAKLQLFLQWLQANGGELRGSTIRHCGPSRGFGVFSTSLPAHNNGDGVVMVVPLNLAITPMRVLQDPFLGPRCRALFEEGHIDDRFLIMLFLMVERLRSNSLWKPYLDILPSSFGNPLWFTENELNELKGTTLYRATMLQRKSLQALYQDKVKGLVEELSHSDELQSTREVQYEDFLWANSIFWTRALNIPFPHSYVFPGSIEEQDKESSFLGGDYGASVTQVPGETSNWKQSRNSEDAGILLENNSGDETSKSVNRDPLWVEGLVPGIDFCNHGFKGAATWEVDPTGAITGVPASMYLVLGSSSGVSGEREDRADQRIIDGEAEISISYGNKGNEELLYLYGFVVGNNPDDYLMVHYPVEALQQVPFFDRKSILMEIQEAELRCLLPKSLLDHGFFSNYPLEEEDNKRSSSLISNYSWSGRRKVPSYLSKLVFPQEFITALRTIAMKEDELDKVSSLLGELAGSEEEREPSASEVQAAVWEVCGDYGALELLVDLLRVKMVELEEGTGTEASDTEILEKLHFEDPEDCTSLKSCCRRNEQTTDGKLRRNYWSSVVYRRGQKQLTSLFLREAEHALELCAKG
ncbi:uncharacterized protein LOC109727235 isoform X3 [Ananas comosus]|uniref:Uncharacterized protein LOC109727235 isoform X3 n=1 Tax=Ananas comosus TaxID=4615 RepID=A0A6P5GYF7_ANACO|nr:uncharacterized protein LOC109727235 isoform X3 [Ananas comosus]